MAREGIGPGTRARLERLHRTAGEAPFSTADADAAWPDLSLPQVRRLLSHLAAKGWLSRVRRGVYVTVPLGASDPSDWRGDPWLVAAKVLAPAYIGGWTAAEHWGLTEQLFRDVVVFTERKLRSREFEMQGTAFVARRVTEDKMFGLRKVWRLGKPVRVSEPTRTVVDVLSDPSVGGGARHVADIVEELFDGEHRDDEALLRHAERLGNRTVFKRLGFILEQRGINAPDVIRTCEELKSTGWSLLDPSAKATGRIVRRWNLRTNVRIAPGART